MGSSDLYFLVCRERGKHWGGGEETMAGKSQRRAMTTTLCRTGSFSWDFNVIAPNLSWRADGRATEQALLCLICVRYISNFYFSSLSWR